ncbi:MAG: metal ABC transporter permease [Magnetococcales bacterium]|nr:metal ABC transporter permease [Magnetococcales bacterium]
MTFHELVVDPFVQFAFMRRALAASLALGVGCGPIGVFLMLRRMSLMGDSLSHAILPGVAVGFLLAGFSLPVMTLGGLVAGLLVALLSGASARFTVIKEDAGFAAFQSISLAAGVLIVSTKGGNVDLLHVLFGSVLAVDDAALLLATGCSSLALLVMAVIYRPLVIQCFDPAYLRIAGGGRADPWNMIFLALVVLALVAGFQVMGSLMAVGLMMLPAIAARFWARQVWTMMVAAVLIAMTAAATGLLLSFHFSLPTGPAIVLTAGAWHLFSLLFGPRGGLWSRLKPPARHREN